MRSLPRAVAATAIGKSVDVELLREGQHKRVRIVVGRLSEDEDGEKPAKRDMEPAPDTDREDLLGLLLAPLTDDLRQRYRIGRSVAGVVIVEVDPKSPAAQKGIKPGDVIVEVTQEKVRRPKDVKARLGAVKEIRPAFGAALAVRRARRAEIRRRSDGLERRRRSQRDPSRR